MAKTKKHNLYTGRSGQLAVMSIFLNWGFNAAIPEVDVGEDIFVVRDADGDLSRIQVKSAIGQGTNRRYAHYGVPLAQLQKPHQPGLFYVFAIHYDDLWRDFVVIGRQDLDGLRVNQGIGWLNQHNTLMLRLSFGPADVICQGHNLQPHRNAWHHWPVIQH